MQSAGHPRIEYLLLQASDPLLMSRLPAVQGKLCSELTVLQAGPLLFQLLVMIGCHLQEALGMGVLQVGHLGLDMSI